jgi:DNA repair photolyase
VTAEEHRQLETFEEAIATLTATVTTLSEATTEKLDNLIASHEQRLTVAETLVKNTAQTVQKFERVLTGNGQPGLLSRMAAAETGLETSIERLHRLAADREAQLKTCTGNLKSLENRVYWIIGGLASANLAAYGLLIVEFFRHVAAS